MAAFAARCYRGDTIRNGYVTIVHGTRVMNRQTAHPICDLIRQSVCLRLICFTHKHYK